MSAAPESFCPITGKAKFASAKLAAEVAHRDGKRYRGMEHRKGGLVPYRCEHCAEWHLGRHRANRLHNRKSVGDMA